MQTAMLGIARGGSALARRTGRQSRLMSSVKLTQGSLGAIKSSGITVPSYDRAALAEDPAIVHLGVGGFHRSHMALYTCDALRRVVAAPAAASAPLRPLACSHRAH